MNMQDTTSADMPAGGEPDIKERFKAHIKPLVEACLKEYLEEHGTLGDFVSVHDAFAHIGDAEVTRLMEDVLGFEAFEILRTAPLRTQVMNAIYDMDPVIDQLGRFEKIVVL